MVLGMVSLAFPAFVILSFFAFAEAGGEIGVNYGRVANDLPTPEKVVELLKLQGINRVKIFDTEPTVLKALANSGISVVVTMPNEILSSTAADQSFADNWVKTNILQYYPDAQIEAVAVGNEVFVAPNNLTKFLVPAMKNLYNSFVKFNLSSIKLSSPVAIAALKNSYPSSAGSFEPELAELAIKPMLKFLRQTGSYFMLNAYPFFAYAANSKEISLDYALFKENQGAVDSGNGLKYYSLLEAQIDAVYAAMSALQYDDIKIVVTETGWPSQGDEDEIGATEANAASYNANLVKRVLTGNGTPLRPKDPLNVYLFALFNENQKSGPTSERNYGLFYPSEKKVYDVPFAQKTTVKRSGAQNVPANRDGDQVSTPVRQRGAHVQVSRGVDDVATPVKHGGEVQAPVSYGAGDVSTTSVGHTWCVANGKAGAQKLQAALDYACGQGQADCRPIQPDATCFDPNSLEAHASYAFNSYYQKNARAAGTCDFGGAAYVVTQAPSFGNCKFPTGY